MTKPNDEFRQAESNNLEVFISTKVNVSASKMCLGLKNAIETEIQNFTDQHTLINSHSETLADSFQELYKIKLNK